MQLDEQRKPVATRRIVSRLEALPAQYLVDLMNDGVMPSRAKLSIVKVAETVPWADPFGRHPCAPTCRPNGSPPPRDDRLRFLAIGDRRRDRPHDLALIVQCDVLREPERLGRRLERIPRPRTDEYSRTAAAPRSPQRQPPTIPGATAAERSLFDRIRLRGDVRAPGSARPMAACTTTASAGLQKPRRVVGGPAPSAKTRAERNAAQALAGCGRDVRWQSSTWNVTFAAVTRCFARASMPGETSVATSVSALGASTSV